MALEINVIDNVGGLPKVSAADNGKILKVVNGAWDDASEKTELPSVSTDDNGKVLMVVNGMWDVSSGGGSSYADGIITKVESQTGPEEIISIAELGFIPKYVFIYNTTSIAATGFKLLNMSFTVHTEENKQSFIIYGNGTHAAFELYNKGLDVSPQQGHFYIQDGILMFGYDSNRGKLLAGYTYRWVAIA